MLVPILRLFLGFAPADAAACPLWFKFLFEATARDLEVIRFLQQWAGYSLTGDTREEAFVFAQGEGGFLFIRKRFRF